MDAATYGEAMAKGSFGQVESDGLQGEEQGVAWRRYRISASPHDPPLPPEHNYSSRVWMGLGSYNDGSRGDKDHFATSPNCVTELKGCEVQLSK